jgi:hypothetical protein
MLLIINQRLKQQELAVGLNDIYRNIYTSKVDWYMFAYKIVTTSTSTSTVQKQNWIIYKNISEYIVVVVINNRLLKIKKKQRKMIWTYISY